MMFLPFSKLRLTCCYVSVRFRSLSSGPLRHPGTCRGTAAVLLKRPSTACSVAANQTDHTRTPLDSEAVASPPFLSLDPRQQHQQVQSQGTPAARPATAQPSSGTRGSERRLELLQRCRPPLGSASSLIVETGDDVALLDRRIWSSKGQQSGPYEDARKRQAPCITPSRAPCSSTLATPTLCCFKLRVPWSIIMPMTMIVIRSRWLSLVSFRFCLTRQISFFPRRLEGRHSGYIRHALPQVLNRAVLMNMKAGGAPHDTDDIP